MRLEGWAAGKVRVPALRDAVLRTASEGEVIGRVSRVIRGVGQDAATTGSG